MTVIDNVPRTQIAYDITLMLERLGSTPDEIAQSLRVSGVKGMRRQGNSCPITHWLEKQMGGRAFTSQQSVSWIEGPDLREIDPTAMVWVAVPEPVVDFVTRFDDGVYPDLVEHAVRIIG